MRFLIRNGATVYVKNKMKETPLDLAEANEQSSDHHGVASFLLLEFISFLLKNQALLGEPDIDEFVGVGSEMFHLKPRFKGKSLIEYIMDNGGSMLKERETLIDFLVKIDELYFPNDDENREFRVIDQLKRGLPSSEGLASCISSVREKFPWTRSKMWIMRFISFFQNIVIGWSLYMADFLTDYKFSQEIGSASIGLETMKNSTECLNIEIEYHQDALNYCSQEFHRKWLYRLECESNARVSSKFIYEENLSAVASNILLLHCFLPWIFALLLCVTLCNKIFPIPLWTKFYKFLLQWRLYFFSTSKDSEDKDYLRTKLMKNQQNIALSMLGEAAFEAGFQFWFQTNYYFPSLISHVMTLNDIHEILNWKFASIILSFVSFAWASCAVR